MLINYRIYKFFIKLK